MLHIAPDIRLSREVAIWAMCTAVHEAFSIAGYDTTITSGTSGQHTVGSEHYVGHAIDWRTKHVPRHTAEGIRDDVAERLGLDFDVILETDPPHLHTEWDPK